MSDWPQFVDAKYRHPIIGISESFRQVISVAESVAGNDSVVLLEGETGTGKELLARFIHNKSERSEGPFIPVNCPAISENLFESQFYGHVKGAFTGANTDTLGAVRAAEGGTLLLDEVGELQLHLQPKLLRLLQEFEVTPVGAARPIKVDTRFLASTNQSLRRLISRGDFRSDLYHRLNIVRIEIPPLRNRRDDIEPILDYYLEYYSHFYKMPKREISRRLRNQLCNYDWPGNIRELCGYVERLYAADVPAMPPGYYSQQAGLYENAGVRSSYTVSTGGGDDLMPPVPYEPVKQHDYECCTIAQAEAQAIRKALQATGYNRSAAARILAIHRSTLLRKMRMLGLHRRF